jgi:hypothetical protein
MAAPHMRGKLHPPFTLTADNWHQPVSSSPALGRIVMVGIAIAMFIAVFGWGSRYFGWEDPNGKVQLALATCFVLGVISGYKAKS